MKLIYFFLLVFSCSFSLQSMSIDFIDLGELESTTSYNGNFRGNGSCSERNYSSPTACLGNLGITLLEVGAKWYDDRERFSSYFTKSRYYLGMKLIRLTPDATGATFLATLKGKALSSILANRMNKMEAIINFKIGKCDGEEVEIPRTPSLDSSLDDVFNYLSQTRSKFISFCEFVGTTQSLNAMVRQTERIRGGFVKLDNILLRFHRDGRVEFISDGTGEEDDYGYDYDDNRPTLVTIGLKEKRNGKENSEKMRKEVRKAASNLISIFHDYGDVLLLASEESDSLKRKLLVSKFFNDENSQRIYELKSGLTKKLQYLGLTDLFGVIFKVNQAHKYLRWLENQILEEYSMDRKIRRHL